MSPSARRRQLKQIERRRSQRQAEARQTQAQQARAAIQYDLSRRRRRHAIAAMMFILAGVLAVYHLFEHLDVVPAMTGRSGLDDLLFGWPMAGVLAVTGAIVYGT
jgi:hypothetical protein